MSTNGYMDGIREDSSGKKDAYYYMGWLPASSEARLVLCPCGCALRTQNDNDTHNYLRLSGLSESV